MNLKVKYIVRSALVVQKHSLLCSHLLLSCGIVTGRNEVVAKVIFLHLSVILFTEGVSASVHAGIPPPQEQTPPKADTPQGRHPPKADTPLGPDPPEQTPPGKQTPG